MPSSSSSSSDSGSSSSSASSVGKGSRKKKKSGFKGLLEKYLKLKVGDDEQLQQQVGEQSREAEPVVTEPTKDSSILEVKENTLIIAQDGKKYEIGRFCPHKQVDLSVRSEITPGHVKCLKHNYVFRLTDGKCISNDKPCVLSVKELEW